MSFDFKGLIGSILPTVASLIPIPGASAVVAGICKACGLEPSVENAETAAQMIADGKLTPEQQVAVMKIESDLKLQMAQLGLQQTQEDNKAKQQVADNEIQLDKNDGLDRADARHREEIIKDSTSRYGFYTITVGFFGLLTLLLFRQIPTSNEAVLHVLVGSLGAAWLGCVNYYYGSSHSAKDATAMLYNSTPLSKK